MKQVLQHLKSGEIELAELPCPTVRPGGVLIRSSATLISPGTERMLVEFSQANLLQKARQQPEKVRQVLDKMRTDGLMPTLEAVFRKLDEPMPLGYCNAGKVIEVGSGVDDLRPGDRVVSNGPHAEIVSVPRNLCARIPDAVSDEDAAFTVMGSIALQGLRLAQPTLGEQFVVFGVGLLGLLTVQLLRAHGCEVLAVDVNAGRLALAERFGARTANVGEGADPVTAAMAWTEGRGVDGVLITASARTDDIVHQAAESCRKRGRIVLVGVVGLNLRRSDFYEKELTFQVSCSYGPGRYDDAYEQRGHDYPLGFVRWTEQRNFDAVLAAIAGGRLDLAPLATHRFSMADAGEAYDLVRNDPSALGIVLDHGGHAETAPEVEIVPPRELSPAEPTVALIGAGNFAKAVLLPALATTPARLAYVANRDAAGARYAAKKFGAEKAVTDYRQALEDSRVRAVFLVVGHHQHATMTREALEAGKHVFVEKPLALDEAELDAVEEAYRQASGLQLMVGYNRRFSPHAVAMKKALSGRGEPLCMTMTVNAGELPADHWTQDPRLGGGRIVGEGCHFIDLMVFLTGSPVTTVSAGMVGPGPAVRDDKTSIVLGFADGSLGTLHYFANGPKSYPKERMEIFSDGRVLSMDNFRMTRGYGFSGFRRFRTMRQDKGHAAELQAFVERVRDGGAPLIPFDELRNVSLASFAAVRSARERQTIRLDA